MTGQKYPRSKSIARAAQTAKARDDAARKKRSVDSFVNFAHNLGVGADNAMTSSTYGFNPITRNRTLLEWMHRGSWLAGVAVDTVADDMTRAGIIVKSECDPADLAKLNEAAVRWGVWNVINETIRWSRLYGGAIAVMLIDGQDMETPLRLNTIRKGQFRGLLSLDRWMVEPTLNDLVTDLGPSLGLPKFYNVTAQAPGLSRMKIHHSRCVRLIGDQLPYWQRVMENLWGLSVLERLNDRMIAFDSATTGAAQLVYKSYIRTYKIDGLREVIAAGGDALIGLSQYVDMMRRYQGIEGMTLLDAKDEMTADVHSAFGGLADVLQQFEQQLSGALQIPLVRLFGQSPVGFSTGDTDLVNYYDTIRQKQIQNLQTPVATIYRVMATSEGIDLPEGTTIEFNSLWQMDDEKKASIAETITRTVAAAEESGLITKATALKELKQSSDITGIMSNITDEDIEEAEADGPPLPESSQALEGMAKAPSDQESEKGASAPTTKDEDGGWIGVDFDGTLAHHEKYQGPEDLGAPIPEMVALVRGLLAQGKAVRIFTARADDPDSVVAIKDWCYRYLGQSLDVTNIKDRHMKVLYDDRAIHVERNTGKVSQ